MNALLGQEVDRVPALCVTQTGTVELMQICGAFWPEAHIDADKMAGLAYAAHVVAGFEAVRIPFGMCAEAETLGCPVNYHEGRIDFTPTITDPLKDLNSLRVAEPTEGRMATVVEATKILREKAGAHVPVILGVVGPFNLGSFVYGIDSLMRHLVIKPDNVEKVLEITWQVVAKFCNALSRAGADAITLLEPTASLIGTQLFEKFTLPYLKKVVNTVECPLILHICGNTLPILDQMAESGVKGLSIESIVGVRKAKEIVRNRASLIGNMDPVKVLLNGKPEDVMREGRRIIDEGVDILAPGCGLPPHTPLANMKAMVSAARDYGNK
jgi:[methyl-Co(III) methanol-specific corrinoid protein]:coenzyme M methyltransferase